MDPDRTRVVRRRNEEEEIEKERERERGHVGARGRARKARRGAFPPGPDGRPPLRGVVRSARILPDEKIRAVEGGRKATSACFGGLAPRKRRRQTQMQCCGIKFTRWAGCGGAGEEKRKRDGASDGVRSH